MQSISVIIPSFNEADLLSNCLMSLRSQDYDQKKIQVVVADGGSNDRTKDVVKKYNAQLITENSNSPEAAKATALGYAKNELILMLDCDNLLPGKNWLKTMASVFEKETEIVGCYTLRYTYRKTDNPLNRYFALFGVNDPVAYFLDKADRQSYLSNSWSLGGAAVDKGNYFLVKFSPDTTPTLGANGFLIRRSLLVKANISKKFFYHIDVNLDLIHKGLDTYAVTKNDVVHSSGESLSKYLSKRKRYMQDLFLRDADRRRYKLFDPAKDKFRIAVFSFLSLTLLAPFLLALRGYIKIRDRAWFLHPLVCFLLFWIYAWSYLKALVMNLLLMRKSGE
jgi:glycosyltransferase involved in cell wall biosynthesis